MPTIQDIENQLIAYAQAGDLVDFTRTVNSITADQKSQLDPLQIGQALDILASLTTQAPADVAAAASHFMARLGAFTDVGALGTALDDFGQANNYDGMKAVIDHLGDTQKPQLGTVALDNALNDIVFPNAPTDPAITNAALLDYMTHLGAYTDAFTLGQDLVRTAQTGNLAGAEIIIDHIDAAQKPLLDPVELGNALGVIANPFIFPIDPSVSNPVLLDFMTHLGAYTDPSALVQALFQTADLGNLAGADIIIDHIDAAQKPLLDPVELGNALGVIANPFIFPIDPSVSNPVLLDFMTHLGAYTDPSALVQALFQTADLGNLAGADIIIDHIDAAQKPLLDPAELGQALGVIANPFIFPIDPSVSNPVLLDFMTHLGAYTDPFALGQALIGTAGIGNLAGADIIIDHIDAAQKPLLDPTALGNTLQDIANPFIFPIDPSVSNPVLLDFMTHLGAYTDPFALGQALIGTAGIGNLAGADIIIDHIDTAQKSLLDPVALDNALGSIANPSIFPIDPSVSNPVLLDFMTHLGAYTDPFALGQALIGTAGIGNLAGTEIIIDHIDAAQKPLLDPTALDNTLQDIVSPIMPTDQASTDAALLDYMTHLGAYTDPSALGQALGQLASLGDFIGASEIADHIAAAQKPLLDPSVLGNALASFSNFDAADPSGVASADANLMAKLGVYVPGAAIESAAQAEGMNGNWQAAAEIIGHLTDTQAAALSGGFQSWMTANGIQQTGVNGATLTAPGTADDVLVARGANETLNGNGGDDTLYGDGHYDVLNAGAGNDVLIGHGTDTLTGGAGADRFVLDGHGQTNVANFGVANGDVLDLRDVLAPTDDLLSHVSNYVQLVDTAAGTVVNVDHHGTAGAARGWTDIGLLENVHNTDLAALIASHSLVV